MHRPTARFQLIVAICLLLAACSTTTSMVTEPDTRSAPTDTAIGTDEPEPAIATEPAAEPAAEPLSPAKADTAATHQPTTVERAVDESGELDGEATSPFPDRSLTPSGPVDFGAEDHEWFTTGIIEFPLQWLDDESFDAGFSMYVAAWPWQEVHGGPRYSSGLPGTWMSARDDDGHGFYSTIEGGIGTGAGNRFPSQGTKFTMGGVSADFTHWANGPGAGGGLEAEVHWEEWNWEIPQGKYGIAQLSPYVLFPPDGLNLAPDSNGGLFGYGYHPLPIIESRTVPGIYGDVETGDQSWTLFLSTANFQGPVAFFLPDFYSYPVGNVPEVAEVAEALDASPFLDSVGSDQNQQFAVETWEIPAVQAVDSLGTPYAKMTRTQFPANGGDEDSSIVLHNISAYQRGALWDATDAWFAGGSPTTGELDADSSYVKEFDLWDDPNEYFGWMIIPEGVDDGDPEYQIDWSSLVQIDLSDPNTFRYRWNLDRVERTDDYFVIPEYFRLDDDPTATFGKVWTPILASEVPEETGLVDYAFATLDEPQSNQDPFETPTDPESPWKSPGPATDTYQVELGDGSVIEYAWYRFVDQPAMRHHAFTDAERERIQERVEMIHGEWGNDRPYLAPPETGELAALSDAVLVTPPEGMDVGYVPIVTRQALATT